MQKQNLNTEDAKERQERNTKKPAKGIKVGIERNFKEQGVLGK